MFAYIYYDYPDYLHRSYYPLYFKHRSGLYYH